MPAKRLNKIMWFFAALLAASSLQAQAANTQKTHVMPAHHSDAVVKPHVDKKHVVAKKHTPTHKHTPVKKHHAVAVHHAGVASEAATAAPVAGVTRAPDFAARMLESHPSWLPLSLQLGPVVEAGAMHALAAPQATPSLVSVAAAAVPSIWLASTATPAGETEGAADDGVESVQDLRHSLISLAMSLRDTRYARGGRTPSTGFDCSGFVRYVFAHAIGMKLPTSSAAQFLAGLKVSRDEIKPGDLVFFRIGGKRSISHVGIYLSHGRFIHSPASGKSVQVSSLSEAYWAKHFAGAKRPAGIAAAIANNG